MRSHQAIQQGDQLGDKVGHRQGYKQGHQEVAAEAASTVEVVGMAAVAAVEMPKITGHL